jgi:hypothetical protein
LLARFDVAVQASQFGISGRDVGLSMDDRCFCCGRDASTGLAIGFGGPGIFGYHAIERFDLPAHKIGDVAYRLEHQGLASRPEISVGIRMPRSVAQDIEKSSMCSLRMSDW